jgi:hypothetical protein
MKTRGLRGLLAIALASSILVVNSAWASPGGTAPTLISVSNGEALVYLAEEDGMNEWGSRLKLQPDAPDANLQRAEWIDCPTIDDPICDFSKKGYGPLAFLTMPLCESATAEDCIEGVSFFRATESLTVEYFGDVPGQPTFPADEKTQLYRGGVAPIYRVAGAPHAGGDLYMIAGRATLNYQVQDKRFKTNDFYLYVIPISLQSASYVMGFRDAFPCIWGTPEVCAVRHDFPQGLRIGVDLRLNTDIGGWFLGRMQTPDVKVEPFSQRNNKLSVVAAPVEVARFAYKAPKSQFTLDDLRAAGNVGGLGTFFQNDSPTRISNSGYDTSNFGLLNHYRDRVKDTAIGATTHWGLRTTSTASANGCLADNSRVLGVVSTNAMVYDGFAPKFSNGFLDYRVAGLHLMPDGETPVVGTYDLVMRSETARCLYGFTNAPVSATVTITGTGNLNVATTLVSERNGWLQLAAYGFTFSEKGIRVALTQKAAPVPQTLSLAKFSGTSTKLSSTQRWAIEDFVLASTLTKSVTCTAMYVKTADKARALARAKEACVAVKALKRTYVVKTVATQTKTKSLDGRVVLQSR